MAILKGDNKKNTLIGRAGDDELLGLAGNDMLNGKAGNDKLDVGLGADSMVGGLGNDVYIVDNKGDTVKEGVDAGVDAVKSGVDFALGNHIENLTLTGGLPINGTGNVLSNDIWGNVAANLLIGNAGNDMLNGNFGIDTLLGGTGNDVIKIKDYNGDVIDGGRDYDVLEITGRSQFIDMTNTGTSIVGIETIKLSGFEGSTLKLDTQTLIENNPISITLTIEGDRSDRVYLEAGWLDTGMTSGYRTFTKQEATLRVEFGVNVQISEAPTYVISDAKAATLIKPFFTDATEQVLVDLGRVLYSKSDLSGGIIDLNGFGLEDTLKIAKYDGVASIGLTFYNQSLNRITFRVHLGSRSNMQDRILWQKNATVAKLMSVGATGAISTVAQSGSIQIIGLPKGLADSQFVFV